MYLLEQNLNIRKKVSKKKKEKKLDHEMNEKGGREERKHTLNNKVSRINNICSGPEDFGNIVLNYEGILLIIEVALKLGQQM